MTEKIQAALPRIAQFAYDSCGGFDAFRVEEIVKYVRSTWRRDISWVPSPGIVSLARTTWDTFNPRALWYIWLLLHETHHCYQAWRAGCRTWRDWWTWYWPQRGLYAPANLGLEGESDIWADRWVVPTTRYAQVLFPKGIA